MNEQPFLSEEPTPVQAGNPVSSDRGFRIMLAASLPILVIGIISALLGMTGSGPLAFVSALLVIPQLVVFLWWQIKVAREKLAAEGYDVPSYWQVLCLCLVWGIVANIASFVVAWIPLAGGVLQAVMAWVVAALLVGKFLGKPYSEDASKIVSILLIVLGAAVMLLSIGFILFAIGLSSG